MHEAGGDIEHTTLAVVGASHVRYLVRLVIHTLVDDVGLALQVVSNLSKVGR